MIEFEELAGDGKLDGGPVGSATGSRVLFGALGIVLLLIVGYLALAPDARPEPPGPSSTPTPSSTPRAYWSVRPGPQEYLVLGEVCPVRIEGDRLAVSFLLINPSGSTITVLEVVPDRVTGLAALRVLAGGDCSRAGTAKPGAMIEPGGSRRVTVEYRIGADCPQPLPVRVRARIGVNRQQLIGEITVFSSLASVDFEGCPPRHR